MSLQDQMQRAKQLQLTEVPGSKDRIFGTFGSKKDHYQIRVSKYADTRQFGNMMRGITVFNIDCQQTKANKTTTSGFMQLSCKGNCQKHTICYHSQAALLKIFDDKDINFQRSISNDVAKSGNIALVETPDGGSLWIVVREETEVIEEAETKVEDKPIVNLMRGDINDEGID